MANKTKFGFGSSENLEQALEQGLLNARDIVLLDEDTDNPKIGWISKSGEAIILTDEKADLSEVEKEIANLESAIAAKVSAEEVDSKIESALNEIECAPATYEKVEYEITSKPVGTLVDCSEKEIRVMIPKDYAFTLQNSGTNSDSNSYYIGLKAYAPEDAVNFKEDLAEIIADDTLYAFEGNDFAGVDEFGRKYSIVWLPVAKYDGTNWTYYGANSSSEKYIGWYYSVEWYDANGIMIASDCIRINLSNEDCHSAIEPYYIGQTMEKVEEMIAKAIEDTMVVEVIEF